MKLVDNVEIEIYNDNEAISPTSMSGKVKIPEIIGILPIRSAVAFPGTVIPLAIGRKRSQALIKDIEPEETVFGLLAQCDPDIENPGPEDLYTIGTAASVLKVINMPHGTMNIIVHGLERFRIVEFISHKPYLKARVEPIETKTRITKKVKAMMVNIRHDAARVIALSPSVPDEVTILIENIEQPNSLADFLAATLNIPLEQKQEMLEEFNSLKRLEMVSHALADQLEVLELSHKIQDQVRQSIDKTQREYYLQEELKAIQAELGQSDSRTAELHELREKIKHAAMPQTVETEALREVDRMSKIPLGSPEYGVIRSWVDWTCEIPWSASSQDLTDLKKAERILNKDHYGLTKVKRRILEFLAVRSLNPEGKSPILCFVGPPGVGKTSLGQSIARAMGRKFVRLSLGGIRDEADIRGHRRTYIGALPGRILQELRKCGTNNPVFMLDEMDKIGKDFRGDPASALLEVLDPQQNSTFTDHYLDQPFDLSGVMFIGTANYTEPIPPALNDRMEVIELPGYTENEKLKIAKRYLIPRQLKENGLKKDQLVINDQTIANIIRDYTREAGVRNLERAIASVCRFIATKIAKKQINQAEIEPDNLAEILGPIRFESETASRTALPGVATGLAYTPTGGQILFIESAMMPGKGKIQLTGQIGDVMKESAQAAFSVVKSMAKSLGIQSTVFAENDFHLHVPAGAVPKDGPSAGIAMFTSLVSLLTGKPAKSDVAMTGEITLKGLILPIGGLKEKILAAKQAGIKNVILPMRNKKDMAEVPREAKSKMKFTYISNAKEILKKAL